jgi:pilus assembly protein CpaE
VKERFIAVTEREEHVAWLQSVLGGETDVVVADDPVAERIAQLCDAASSGVVFIRIDAADASARSHLIYELLQRKPRLGVVAISDQSQPDALLSAMRAGARDFVRVGSDPSELRGAVERLAAARPAEGPAPERTTQLAVLCARPDIATSAFAVHLALACVRNAAPGEEVLLVDLGLPSSDSLTFLDIAPSYSFVDAARSLRRFDQTLIKTAFARHNSGLAVLPLPDDPEEMDQVSTPDILSLFGILKSYFRYGIVNLGGLRSPDFLLQALARVDRAVLVAEQSVVACAAAHKLVESLAARGYAPATMSLLVDRYTRRVEPSAEKIADLLGVPLLGTLPPNGFELLRAMNLAKSVFEMSPRSAYGAGVWSAAEKLLGRAPSDAGLRARAPAWLGRLLRRP